MENKNTGNENKIILRDFNYTMDKIGRDGGNKTQSTGMVKIKDNDFIDALRIIPCQNSSWTMGLRIYGEGRTQVPLSSPATISPLARIQERQGLC